MVVGRVKHEPVPPEVEIERAAKRLGVPLNAGQRQAGLDILAAVTAKRFHRLTGYAGSGKTTLVQVVMLVLSARRVKMAGTAPTHKAVAVLSKKVKETGAEASFGTIQSLLGLKPKPQGDRLTFTRDKYAEPVNADVIFLDETSMVGRDLMVFIRRYLTGRAVIFVGDPAQLSPVGEARSEAFDIPDASHLDETVRQAADNPVVQAALVLRACQGGAMDWSWCQEAKKPPFGVYKPGDDLDRWLHRGFMSSDFDKDPDTFRYLAWTNRRVADINARVQAWKFGADLDTPFAVKERVLLRAPIIQKKAIQANTNEEMTVLSIERSEQKVNFEKAGDVARWSATIPTWAMKLRSEDGMEIDTHLAASARDYEATSRRIADEANMARSRWGDFHRFKEKFAQMQGIPALTVHNSQGSTFRNVFIDVLDIRRRIGENHLECQQLFYTGFTRPTHAVMLAGV